jgi:hypothetical protein
MSTISFVFYILHSQVGYLGHQNRIYIVLCGKRSNEGGSVYLSTPIASYFPIPPIAFSHHLHYIHCTFSISTYPPFLAHVPTTSPSLREFFMFSVHLTSMYMACSPFHMFLYTPSTVLSTYITHTTHLWHILSAAKRKPTLELEDTAVPFNEKELARYVMVTVFVCLPFRSFFLLISYNIACPTLHVLLESTSETTWCEIRGPRRKDDAASEITHQSISCGESVSKEMTDYATDKSLRA